MQLQAREDNVKRLTRVSIVTDFDKFIGKRMDSLLMRTAKLDAVSKGELEVLVSQYAREFLAFFVDKQSPSEEVNCTIAGLLFRKLVT